MKRIILGWTSKEEEIVLENYYLVSLEGLSRLLPNRTESAIRNKAAQLRKKGRRFKKSS